MSRAQLPTDFLTEDTYAIIPKPQTPEAASHDHWLPHEPEGQLAVDVSETDEAIIITTPIAGVKPEDLEIFVSQDLVTIRGKREDCAEVQDRRFLFKECHWGAFSRSVIMPVHVSTERAEAVLKAGVLTLTLPKNPDAMYVKIKEEYDDEL